MLSNEGECLVITLWQSKEDAIALSTSERYQQTVKAIQETGFLQAQGSIKVYDVHLSELRPALHGHAPNGAEAIGNVDARHDSTDDLRRRCDDQA